MSKLAKLLVLATLSLVMIGSTSEARAETITVRLDNLLTDGYVYAGTSGRIKVEVVAGNFIGSQNRVLNTLSEAHDFSFDLGAYTFGDICRVTVSIMSNYPYSDNLFVLDQIHIYKGNGTRGYVSGAENAVGYCFSTDSGDGADSHCQYSVAYPLKDFYPNGFCPS